MKIIIALILSVAVCQVAAETKFYQCKDKWGQPVFSDKPCGADAHKVAIEGPQASGSVAPEDFSKVSASNALLKAERRVDYLEDRIDRYENERDSKLAALKRDSYRANNNLAGAQWQESLATEMQSVNAEYASKIQIDRDEINRIEVSARGVSALVSE